MRIGIFAALVAVIVVGTVSVAEAATPAGEGKESYKNAETAPPAAVSSAQAERQSGGDSSGLRAESAGAAASGAAGAYIATSDDTCMGSSSAGGQGEDFGFSVASSWRDPSCITIKNARELKAHGYPNAARARLCMDEDNALAFELAGEPCPRVLPSTQAALEKIRAAGGAGFAAEPAQRAQLASLEDASGSVGADGPAAASQAGTLLAMVQSGVQALGDAIAAAADPAPEPYSLYGSD